MAGRIRGSTGREPWWELSPLEQSLALKSKSLDDDDNKGKGKVLTLLLNYNNIQTRISQTVFDALAVQLDPHHTSTPVVLYDTTADRDFVFNDNDSIEVIDPLIEETTLSTTPVIDPSLAMFSSGKKLKRKRSASALDINSIVSLLKDKNDRDEERYQAQLDVEKRRDTIMQAHEEA